MSDKNTAARFEFDQTWEKINQLIGKDQTWIVFRHVSVQIDDFSRHKTSQNTKYWGRVRFTQNYNLEGYQFETLRCSVSLYYEQSQNVTAEIMMLVAAEIGQNPSNFSSVKQEKAIVPVDKLLADGISKLLQMKFDLAKTWFPPYSAW